MTTTIRTIRRAICGQLLKDGCWIVGKCRNITGKRLRYCWPGERWRQADDVLT